MKFCKYVFPDGPMIGQTCGALIIASCDKSKPSKLVEWMGTLWTPKYPQKMNLFPTADKQSDFCHFHQEKNDKIGKES